MAIIGGVLGALMGLAISFGMAVAHLFDCFAACVDGRVLLFLPPLVLLGALLGTVTGSVLIADARTRARPWGGGYFASLLLGVAVGAVTGGVGGGLTYLVLTYWEVLVSWNFDFYLRLSLGVGGGTGAIVGVLFKGLPGSVRKGLVVGLFSGALLFVVGNYFAAKATDFLPVWASYATLQPLMYSLPTLGAASGVAISTLLSHLKRPSVIGN